MARPKKTGTDTPQEEKTAQAKPGDLIQVIPARKLKALMTEVINGDKDAKLITRPYREKIADAIENDHLHAKAFAGVKQELRMSPEKLRDYYDHQEHYREVLGLFKRADSAPGLPLDGAAAEGAAGPANDDKPFPMPSSIAAE